MQLGGVNQRPKDWEAVQHKRSKIGIYSGKFVTAIGIFNFNASQLIWLECDTTTPSFVAAKRAWMKYGGSQRFLTTGATDK